MAQPLLKRFEITLFKDKSQNPPDNTQVPAGNATVDIHRQGVTLATAFNLPQIVDEPVTIDVYDVGRIAAGDTLRVFQSGFGGPLLVDSIPDSSTSMS